MQSRRSFLQLMGAGIGAALLPACGNSGNGTQSLPSPNGYQFMPLVSEGDALPGGRTIKQLLGHFQWLSVPNMPQSVSFQAVDDQDKTGIYEFIVDASSTPKVMSRRKVLREDDVLIDKNDFLSSGRTVTRHTVWEANASGSTLVLIETAGKTPAVYLEVDRGGFKHILSQSSMGGTMQFGARLGSVTLAANHDLLVVASFQPRMGDPRGPKTRMGLHFLPGADPSNAQLLVAAGDPAPGGGTFAGFGLAELGPKGAYAFQAGVLDGGGTITTQVFSGNKDDPMSITQLQTDESFSLYHPRFDLNGQIGQVVHISDDDMQLRYQGKTLLKTGDTSPGGNTIAGIHPPVFTSTNLLVVVETSGPMELCHFNGSAFKTVLASGDGILGKEVQQFVFGTFPRQADGNETFAALIGFGSQGQSIMLATPA